MPSLPDFALLLAASTQLLTLQPSHLVLEGSANIGRWRCRSNTVIASMQVGATPAEINAAADRVAELGQVADPLLATPEFRLRVPIAAMHCANRVMDREMARALRSAEHPSIEFHLHDILGPLAHEAEGGRFTARVSGDVTVAGVTRRLQFPISAWRISARAVYVRAAVPLKMSEFGIRPPTSMLGLIRSRDDVIVRFDLRMSIVEASALR